MSVYFLLFPWVFSVTRVQWFVNYCIGQRRPSETSWRDAKWCWSSCPNLQRSPLKFCCNECTWLWRTDAQRGLHDISINIKLQCCLFPTPHTGDHHSSLLKPADITAVTHPVQNCFMAICCCRNGRCVKMVTFMRILDYFLSLVGRISLSLASLILSLM